jgi:hypothetical protein
MIPAGLLRAVLIVSGLAALAFLSLNLGLSGGGAGPTAAGAALTGLAGVAFVRVALFVRAAARSQR